MAGENTPKFNKEYLWNHWTDLDHVKPLDVKYLQVCKCAKNILPNFIIMCIFSKTKK